MLLLDINVWLALTFDVHVHHASAKTWFDGLTDELCFFCRMTQQGFLRLATNQKIDGPDTLTLSEAWDQFDLFMGDPRVSFVAEPAGVEASRSAPMFNLFRPTCPCDPAAKAWVEERLLVPS